MDHDRLIRAALLNPLADGSVAFLHDAMIRWDQHGTIRFVGTAEQFARAFPGATAPQTRGRIILPPMADCHIHIPQHPIRGRFLEGVNHDPPEGRLIAGLNRNVFPAEGRCADARVVEQVVSDFLDDTLCNGVLGGAAYMTVHPQAAAIALRMLPATWSVGLVLMNMNCPPYLRTDESSLARDVRTLAEEFGPRLIVTDRFALTADSALRQRGSRLAGELSLRMQTHLNEQLAEKQRVEHELYPQASSYADVYRRDGLLDRRPILAHCIHNRRDELAMLRDHGCAIAHCPVSNTLLGSGVMPLDEIIDHGIDYALCTDVGASPTTSLLVEMTQFLLVHRHRSRRATPSEALQRITRAPARILGLPWSGTLESGQPATFVELVCEQGLLDSEEADALLRRLLVMNEADDAGHVAARQQRLEGLICSITIDGRRRTFNHKKAAPIDDERGRGDSQ